MIKLQNMDGHAFLDYNNYIVQRLAKTLGAQKICEEEGLPVLYDGKNLLQLAGVYMNVESCINRKLRDELIYSYRHYSASADESAKMIAARKRANRYRNILDMPAKLFRQFLKITIAVLRRNI